MKKLLKSICSFFESMGRARAAAVLSQQGHHQLAREIMLGK